MEPKQLKVGLSINIQRSDGRVHLAAISGVDSETQSVSVEWYEKDETKGKEVDFDKVYALNVDLFAPKAVPHSSSQKSLAKPQANRKAKASQLPSTDDQEHVASPKLQQLKAVAAAPPRSRLKLRQQNDPPVVPVSKEDGAVDEPHPPPVPPPQDKQPPPPSNLKPPSVSAKPPQPPPPAVKEKQPAVKSRKSNCVKEVERLKKNREVRRARQAEQLAQRNEDFDPSIPNWEFLQKIRESRAKMDLQPLTGDEPVTSNRICVCVRKRPLNKKELGRKEIDVITVPDSCSVLVHEPKVKVDLTKYLENQSYYFDYSFDEGVSNELVYRYTAQPLVHTIFERGMATCFAYGQTGSGKTHTMGGVFTGREQDVTKGIYALAAADVFYLYSQPENEEKELVVSASFFEIYSGKLYDLLNKKAKLRVLEDAKQQVQVVGLEEARVTCVEDVLRLIQVGNDCRTSGTTAVNQHSSRSHAVFQILLRRRASRKLYGKFSLIDLAGNERGVDTASADRKTRMEGAEINKSLLALKECIRALGRKGAHLPFRGSKLTLVLKDSFIGDNSRTCMIAMVSPGLSSCEHTLNTLRYADRVKELRGNKPGGGEVVVMDKVRELSPPQFDLANEVPPSPFHEDLQFLHISLKTEGGVELDRSAEVLTFHEAISNLVESEEQLAEEHRAIIQEDIELLEEEQNLLVYVDSVDHDIEEYVKRLEAIVSHKLELLSKFNERIRDLHQRLKEEEKASKGLKRPPPVL